MYESYLADPGFGKLNFLARFGLKSFVKPLRMADYKAAQRPDCFVTISAHAAEQIKKYYGREATIIAPPVETDKFKLKTETKPSYYINFSRQVSWKRQDLIVKACVAEKKHLLVIGEGPEHDALVKAAGGSEYVEFLPWLSSDELNEKLANAKAFIFPSLEPFGIAPVEALSAGCPVIAYREGGSRDFIRDGENGVMFDKQSVKNLREAILRFEKMKFDRKKVAKTAKGFEKAEFVRKMQELIDEIAD
jgi:glycosyltransferase involved in cell wall biosynthesis